jgi:putative ABC transport system permease protein
MRLYRALLGLYPASFRHEYGGEMRAIFARRRRDAAGAGARLALWLETIADVVPNAAAVHAGILRHDLRYTFRSLGRARGFALTAIVVSALGIGATTASFSMAMHVLVPRLPFPDAGRLVAFWQDQGFRGYSHLELSPANYRDWREMATTVEAMGAYSATSANVVGVGEPQRVYCALVTASAFEALGVRPELGRAFEEADDSYGAEKTIVLSDGWWRTAFRADEGILGRTVNVDGEPRVVIGVMPPSFEFPTRITEFWLPFQFSPDDYSDRTNVYLHGVARLKPGVTLAQAREDLGAAAARLAREYPKANEKTGATVEWLRDQVPSQSRLLLVALAGASACLLLIACLNLAGLLTARASGRRRELAVRAALGAGRERLVRQMLTESLLLAACGGALGVLVAVAVDPLLARLVPQSLPIAETPGVDWRMLAVAALATVTTGVGFGVVPALRAGRGADLSALADGARAGTGRPTERLRAVLVAGEVAASIALLIGAGLLLRALGRVQDVNPGFDARGVLTLRTWLPTPKYDATARRGAFYRQVLDGVEGLPGVSSAAYVSFLPLAFGGGIWPVTGPDLAVPDEDSRAASVRYLTPGFFKTLGIPLLAGRDVNDADTATAPKVAVVSESFAKLYWPGQNPIGRRFSIAFFERTVVGVAGNVRVRGLERRSEPQVYLPYAQIPDGWMPFYTPKDLVVKTTAGAGALLPAIREIVSRADPAQPISSVRMLSEIVAGQTAPREVQARVLGGFALLAFLLAGIGIHGLLAFTVSARTREISVRMALGARRGDILRMVLWRGVRLAALGIAGGAVLAFVGGRSLQALLAGVSPSDPPTFAAAVALVLAMTLAGSLLPALRATRLDPATAMRVE